MRDRAPLPADIGDEIVALWREFEDASSPEAALRPGADRQPPGPDPATTSRDLATWEPLDAISSTPRWTPLRPRRDLSAPLVAAVRAQAEAKARSRRGDVAALRDAATRHERRRP